MVQAAHGALEAGIKFPYKTAEPSSLIMIGVKNQAALEKAEAYLNSLGIETAMFFEPSWEYGNTSFGTRPLLEDERQHLRKYQLWKP